jgi:hypothetical protein
MLYIVMMIPVHWQVDANLEWGRREYQWMPLEDSHLAQTVLPEQHKEIELWSIQPETHITTLFQLQMLFSLKYETDN